jgi:hypothetical protein
LYVSGGRCEREVKRRDAGDVGAKISQIFKMVELRRDERGHEAPGEEAR